MSERRYQSQVQCQNLRIQVDKGSAQLAHHQPAIDYCFKPALDYKASGQTASQAVLNILSTLREVADSAQVCVDGLE